MNLRWITFSIALITYATFIIGYFVFFRNVLKEKLPLGLQAIRVGAIVGKLLILYSIATSDTLTIRMQLGAIAIYLFALLIFFWAAKTNRAKPLTLAFSPDTPEHIVTQGPYRWVRHPYYSSYLMGYLAGILAAGQWWLVAILVIMTAIYWNASVTEERKFAESSLNGNYSEYQKRTARFIPKVW